MNGDQIEFLAREHADQLMARLARAIPQLDAADRELLHDVLGLMWMEGFGRGMKAVRAVVRDELSKMPTLPPAPPLGMGPLEPEVTP